MAKRFEADAFIDSALHHLEAGMRSSWRFLHKGDTPIEKILFAALFLRVKCSPEIVECVAWITPDRVTHEVPCEWLIVRPQHTLLDWPIDFVVEARSDGSQKWQQLAVECDGHEFHERSKEQASRDRGRDRALQAVGIPIFRFTGSEIFRNPWKCASQILDWAEKVRVGLND